MADLRSGRRTRTTTSRTTGSRAPTRSARAPRRASCSTAVFKRARRDRDRGGDRPRRIVEEGRIGRLGPLAAGGGLRLHPRGGRHHAGGADHASASPRPRSTGSGRRAPTAGCGGRPRARSSACAGSSRSRRRGAAAGHRGRVRAGDGAPLRRPRPGERKTPGDRAGRLPAPMAPNRLRRTRRGAAPWRSPAASRSALRGRGAGRRRARPRGPRDRRRGRGLQRLPHPRAQPGDPPRQGLLRGAPLRPAARSTGCSSRPATPATT